MNSVTIVQKLWIYDLRTNQHFRQIAGDLAGEAEKI